MQTKRAEQVPALQAEAQRPARPARHAAQGAIPAVGQGAVVAVNVGNQVFHQALTKTRPGRHVPITVVGQDDDERRRLVVQNEPVGGRGIL
jgi:hypothetical protein